MASRGKIQTVLGDIDPRDVGVTFTHEHLSMVFDVAHVPPAEAEFELMNCPFDMQHLGWIRQNPYSHKNNLIFNDKQTHDAVLHDLIEFQKYGGKTIVENTTHGLKRNLPFFKEMAQKANINVVAGTGYYIAAAQPKSFLTSRVEELTSVMKDELLFGCEGIKCGLIGELGCSWPLHAFEKANLTAAASVQEELKVAVMIHPGRHHLAPGETLRYFLEAGGNVKKTVMAHLDRTIFDDEELVEFASMGSYCEFDLFGIEVSSYQLNDDVDMRNDAQRIDKLKYLVEQGFEDSIVISHDIHTKHRLTKFGGTGYAHILRYVIPKMLRRGWASTTIDKILQDNPAKWLTVE